MTDLNQELLDFSDVEIDKSSSFGERFKMVTNEKVRIGLIFPTGKGPFVVKKSLWIEDKDTNKSCVDVACIPKDLQAKFKMDEAKQKIGCLIVKYKTDKKGTLVNPLEYEILEWVFAPQKFEDLRNINTDYPLNTFDLTVNCSDEKYQKMTFIPCKGSAMKAAKVESKIQEEAGPMYKSLNSSLGRTFSKEELLAMVGVVSDINISVSNPEELNNILENV